MASISRAERAADSASAGHSPLHVSYNIIIVRELISRTRKSPLPRATHALAREGDQCAPREKRFAEPVKSPRFRSVVSAAVVAAVVAVAVAVIVIAVVQAHKLVRRRWLCVGGHARFCEPTLDIA